MGKVGVKKNECQSVVNKKQKMTDEEYVNKLKQYLKSDRVY